MNKIISLIGCLLTSILLLSCSDCSGDGNYRTKATIYFVNKTSDNIASPIVGCERNINPGDTLKLDINETLGSRANIDNFPVTIFSNCTMAYKDGNNLKCENGINDIKNYEDRKEVTPSEFEFTFRFTEEKKAVASLCE